MNGLQLFDYEGQDVRTVAIDCEPWFVAADVAKILGSRAASGITRMIDDEDKGFHKVETPGGVQTLQVINESGLFTALLRSNNRNAKPLRRWVTSVVLPQIRKTGSYSIPAPAPELDVNNLNDLSRILDAGKAALNRAVAAEAKVAELEPVAAHAQVFRAAEGLRAVGDVANDFKTHAAEAFPGVKVTHQMVWDHAGACHLVIRGNTVRHNQPTSQAISADWAKPHRVQYSTHTRGDQTTVTTRLTPRGEARLWDHLVKYITAYGSLSLQKELTS